MRGLGTTLRSERAARLCWAAIATATLAAVVALAWRQGWLLRLADHRQLVEWMRRDGAAGPLLCIGIQFLQVVIFAIPGEITQIAAGYVFGAWLGFAYALAGIALGSAFAFGFAKAVGRPVMQRLLGAERLARLDRQLSSRNGVAAIFILFLLPGSPKDALSYGAGLTDMSLARFVLLSAPARTPALLLSTLFGSQAYAGDYATMAWIGGAAGLLALAALYYHRRRAR